MKNYFNSREFACPCCGETRMDEDFVIKLNTARAVAKMAFRVNSGFRCEKHNLEVGGKETSSHLKGRAVDLAVYTSTERFLNVLVLEVISYT
jgi:hypothetical protein